MSLLHVNMSPEMMTAAKMFAVGDVVKMKCSLGFTRTPSSLSLKVEDIDLILSVEVTIM